MCDRSYIVKRADVNVARLFLNLQGLEKTTTMLMILTGKKNSWAANKSQRVCDTGKCHGITLVLILVYLTLSCTLVTPELHPALCSLFWFCIRMRTNASCSGNLVRTQHGQSEASGRIRSPWSTCAPPAPWKVGTRA